MPSKPKPSGALPTRPTPIAPTLRHLLATRGFALVRIAILYQLLLAVAVTPLVTLASNAAVSVTGAPAVINSTLTQLLTSPLSVALLLLAVVIGLSASVVAAAASCIAVLNGEQRTGRAVRAASRRVGDLLMIAFWSIWRSFVLGLPLILLAGLAYLAVFGLRGPVAAYARNSSALITIGATLGTALGFLWLYLFLRWLFSTAVYIDGGYRGRAALDRSWGLTSGRWLLLGLTMLGVESVLALAGAFLLAFINSVAIQVGSAGISVELALLLGLSSLVTVLASTALAVAFQAIVLTRYLKATYRSVPRFHAEKVTKSGWALALGVLGLALLTGIAGAASAFLLLQEPVDVARIEVIAHRAGEAYAPENSLAAVETARKDGASRLEFDVQRTSDNHIVVIHDADLLRIAGKDVTVAGSTLAELQQIDIGSPVDPRFADQRIPTLVQFLDAAGETPLALEVKTHPKDETTTREVVALLQKRGAIDRTVLISLDPRLTSLAHSIDPQLLTGDLVSIGAGDSFRLASEVIAPSSGIATAQFVNGAHTAGKKVWVWTLQEEDLVRQAAVRGVDGIITSDVIATRRALDSMDDLTPAETARQRLTDLLAQ